MKRVLIAGVTGMIGKHLAKVSGEAGYDVGGLSPPTFVSRYASGRAGFARFQGDILDRGFLQTVWTAWHPELVRHPAVQANGGESWKAEDSTYLLNIQGYRNVFDACCHYSPEARVIPACSSAEYGVVPDELMPIQKDRTPLHPIAPFRQTLADIFEN